MNPPLKKSPARRIVGSKSSVQIPSSKSSAQKRSKSSSQNAKAKSSSQNPTALVASNPALLPTSSTTLAENREAWLSRAIELLRPEFAAVGSPLPEIVRASIGWTRSRKALAECWSSEASTEKVHEIFVIPTNDMNDPMAIFGILCHELCHAALPDGTAHKKPFVELGHKMLLEGPAKYLNGGDEFKKRWEEPLRALGPIPAKPMVAPHNSSRGGSGNPKKRKLKMTCGECGMTFRLASKWLTEKPLQCPDRDCVGYLDHA